MLINILKLVDKKTKLNCGLILILVLVGSILSAIWPVRLAEIYSNVSSGEISEIQKAISSIVLFGIIYISSEAVIIFRRVCVERIASNSDKKVRINSIKKLLQLRTSYFEQASSGEITAKIDSGISGLNHFMKVFCNDITSVIITIVVIVIQVSLKVPLVFSVIMIGYAIFSLVISKFQIRSQNNVRESIVSQKNKLQGTINESIQNIEFIRSLNAHDYECNRIKPGIENLSKKEKYHHTVMGSYDAIKKVLKVLFMSGLIVLSIYMISKGRLEKGMIIAICLLFQQLTQPIDDIYRLFDDFASSFVKIKALVQLDKAPLDNYMQNKNHVAYTGNDIICLNNCDFYSPSMQKKLCSNINLTIKPGEIVWIQGESGSGKSTILRGIMQYYPTKGTAKICGVDIKDLNHKILTEKICYIPQSSYAFEGTIKENLVYGLSTVPNDTQLVEVLKKACLYKDLVTMNTDVLNIPLYEKATNLSGGMIKRLGLARGFLRFPELYILDESISGIDETTATKMLDNLHDHAKKCNAAILYVSHGNLIEKRCNRKIILHKSQSDLTDNSVCAV